MPQLGERGHQARVADQRLGLVLRAAVAGQQPVIGVDDLGGHQPVEQVPDAGADGGVRYHQPPPQPGAAASGEARTVSVWRSPGPA